MNGQVSSQLRAPTTSQMTPAVKQHLFMTPPSPTPSTVNLYLIPPPEAGDGVKGGKPQRQETQRGAQLTPELQNIPSFSY